MTARLTPEVSERDHLAGSPHARVTLVEYGDYECPYCGEAARIVQAVRRQWPGQVRVVFRHFPLTKVHPHARLAAYAAEASALQGRFWPMHDVLFDHQQALELPDLLRYAERLGVELEQFQRDLSSRTVSAHVRSDFLSGARSGVNGTPSFFLNGWRYDGSWEGASLFLAVEEALEEAPRAAPG